MDAWLPIVRKLLYKYSPFTIYHLSVVPPRQRNAELAALSLMLLTAVRCHSCSAPRLPPWRAIKSLLPSIPRCVIDTSGISTAWIRSAKAQLYSAAVPSPVDHEALMMFMPGPVKGTTKERPTTWRKRWHFEDTRQIPLIWQRPFLGRFTAQAVAEKVRHCITQCFGFARL